MTTTIQTATGVQPVTPTKPDFRAGLVLVAAMMVGTGMIQAPVGTLCSRPVPSGFLLGSRRLTGSYVVLRFLHYLYLPETLLVVIIAIFCALTIAACVVGCLWGRALTRKQFSRAGIV